MSLNPNEEKQLLSLLDRVSKDEFAGSTLRGGWPQPPAVTALPTASKDYGGRVVYLPGIVGVMAGHAYICVQAVDASWSWKQLDN